MGCLLGYFQPFPAPDPIDALDVDPPAFVDKQLTDATIAIATVLRGQVHNPRRQLRFIIADLGATAFASHAIVRQHDTRDAPRQ